MRSSYVLRMQLWWGGAWWGLVELGNSATAAGSCGGAGLAVAAAHSLLVMQLKNLLRRRSCRREEAELHQRAAGANTLQAAPAAS